eukprot:GILK01004881.1.p1 GENE.GILK01004881.1~~GILK01004881.1.p1  ORF type:complete len:379 (-),score=51.08 GILK01004881.1:166-1302(-)
MAESLGRKLRYGMVGGGPPGFIGEAHRRAVAIDGLSQLVAGAFSSDSVKNKNFGADLFLDAQRVYSSYQDMAAAESAMPQEQKLDFVVIVTPNPLHYPVVKTFLEAGFHVVCDKPLATSIVHAEELHELAKSKGLLLALTHNYTGFAMVKQARHMVQSGALGTIRKVVIEYQQGWLTNDGGITITRTSGVSSIHDVGTHAENLAQYITGLEIQSLIANVNTFVGGVRSPDDANVLIKYKGGATGVMLISQSATGEQNGLYIRVYGSDASLSWHLEHPDALRVMYRTQPEQLFKRDTNFEYLCDAAKQASRLPNGHVEGYYEAFATLYRNIARTLIAQELGHTPTQYDLDFPTSADGVRGLKFVDKLHESHDSQSWVNF